jgi:hypothetical protein
MLHGTLNLPILQLQILFYDRPVVHVEPLRPWRQLFVALVKEATVIAERSGSGGSISHRPHGRTPNVAMSASEMLAITAELISTRCL